MNDYFKYTKLNRRALTDSTECACIHCFKKFSPSKIINWCSDINELGIYQANTAICPYCKIDSVVPNALINYTEDDLRRWHQYGFSK